MTMKLTRSAATAIYVAGAFALTSPMVSQADTVQAEPDAFLEYVETDQDSSNDATVTQYIDTGVKAETGLKARMDAVVLSNTRSDSAILGARYNSNRRFLMLHSNGKKAWTAYGLGDPGKWTDSVKHPVDRYEQLVDFSDGAAVQVYVNGLPRLSAAQQATLKSVAEDSATGSISASWMNNLTLYLFAANNGGVAAWPCRIRLYELKILKKNATPGGFDLLRHYLPCIKNGRAGLYDKMNGTISYSYGSADFIAGPVLDKPLDFVRSITGNAHQWFNTWVWGKSGLKSEVEVSTISNGADRAILASRRDGGNTRLFMAYHYETAFRFAHGRLPAKTEINVVKPENNVIGATHNDVRYLIKTDTTIGSFSMTVSRNGGEPVEVLKDDVDYGSDYLATTNTLYILTNNLGGKPTNINAATIYGVKIWDGSELLRDFVPVVATNSSGVTYAGLYDQVTMRIYKRETGSNASDFDISTYQVGDVTNTLRTVARPSSRIEYVESDGDYDYLDLGVLANAGIETELTMEWLAIPGERAFIGARHVLGSGQDPIRLFPYSSNTDTNVVPTQIQHVYHYNHSRYSPRDVDNKAIEIEKNVIYKVVSRLEQGLQNIKLWSRNGSSWEKLGERTLNSSDDVSLGMPLYLFAINEDNLARFPVKARCRSLKLRVKQQGSYALVRNFVPVNDPVTGGAALWDKVSEKYFRNSGKYRLVGGGEERPLNVGTIIVVE